MKEIQTAFLVGIVNKLLVNLMPNKCSSAKMIIAGVKGKDIKGNALMPR